MPLYTYEHCGVHFDRVLPISMCDDPQRCPECGNIADKIVVLGHGGIQRRGDGQDWVRDAARVLTDGDGPNPNIESVDDYRRYLSDHPNIVPADHHPCLPSSVGDVLDKKITKADIEHQKRVRSRKANEKLRELRKITTSAAAV